MKHGINQDRGRYPATTIVSLLSGLLRRVRAVDPDAPNFMDAKNPQFLEMHTIIDRYFRELCESGVGAEEKHTSVISKEEENHLWENGVLGVDTPEKLLRVVFYYNGKSLCLRGGKEHRTLKVSQIVRHDDPPRYVYTENGSKNRNGSYNQICVENKVVPVFPSPEAGARCYFSILEKYNSKLPPVAYEKDWFYMKSLGDDVVSKPGKPWNTAQPCGENKLATMVKSMFAMIGVSGKTNHSLRATGASEMFEAGVPEKIVQERTGHRSTEALRMYERTTTTQYMAVSRVLCVQNDENCSFNSSVSRAPAKQHDAAASMTFSTLFGSVANCVINVNVASPCTLYCYLQLCKLS